MIKNVLLFIAAILTFVSSAYGAPDRGVIDTNGVFQGRATVTPNATYAAGWLHRIFFGDHWRSLWTTPIEAGIIDIHKVGGGLTPLRKGGGLQTKSLKFTGADGRIYKFRSIDKDAGRALGVLPDLQQSVIEDVVQDQVSIKHPMSAIIAAPMLNAVGVLNSQPIMVVLPDDPALGEFRDEYKGLLGIMEIHPDEGPDGEPGFAGSDKVVSTYKMIADLEKRPRHRIDALEFLRARLMDIFLGDWDRHQDQWRWARFAEGTDRKVWKPIPRDRDEAFALYDGFFPWIMTIAVPRFEGIEEDYTAIDDQTAEGRHLDRLILPSVPRQQWDSLTTFLQSRLTDEVIINAVRQMPDDWYELEGKRLEGLLLSRRDKLAEISEEFYCYVVRYPHIWCSNKDDYVSVTRASDEEVRVSVYERGEDGGPKNDEAVYEKTFFTDETCEIRIFLQKGDDVAVVDGETDCSIPVRIVGGKGKDSLVDNSYVHGYFLDITPISDAENLTTFYDSGKKTAYVEGAGSDIDRSKTPEPQNLAEKYEPHLQDYDNDWKFGPWFGFTPDVGLILGGGPILYQFDFRADPSAYRTSLIGAYAFGAKKYAVRFNASEYTLLKGFGIHVEAEKSLLKRTNYFGLGNQTTVDETLEAADFYTIDQEQQSALLEISRGFTSAFSARAGVQIINMELEGGEDLSAFDADTLRKSLFDTTEVSSFNYLKLTGNVAIDNRDNPIAPLQGSYLNVFGAYAPSALENPAEFGKVGFDARAYLPLDFVWPTSLAVRVAGESMIGDFPVHELIYLGGVRDIRGYESERFAGEAKLFANAELRINLTQVRIIIPARYGLTLLADVGRVYLDETPSEKWHSAFGGGFWLSYLDRAVTLQLVAAASRDLVGVYFGAGFQF